MVDLAVANLKVVVGATRNKGDGGAVPQSPTGAGNVVLMRSPNSTTYQLSQTQQTQSKQFNPVLGKKKSSRATAAAAASLLQENSTNTK